MSKIKEVKKILRRFGGGLESIDWASSQICQLFEPKADELGEPEVEWHQEQMLHEKECRKLGKELPLPNNKTKSFVLHKSKAGESRLLTLREIKDIALSHCSPETKPTDISIDEYVYEAIQAQQVIGNTVYQVRPRNKVRLEI